MSVTRRELFRPESLEARRNDWIGRHTLSLGLPAATTSLASVIIAALSVALLTFGTYSRRVDLRGQVMPQGGLIQITAPIGGQVESISVKNDSRIPSGAVLYVLNLDTATSKGNTQERVLQALTQQRALLASQIERKQELRTEQNEEAQSRIVNLESQIKQLAVQIAVKDEYVRNTTKNYSDFLKFQSKGIGTLNETLARQQDWMRARGEFEELKSQFLRLQTELVDTKYKQKSSDLQAASETDALRARLSDLDQLVANSDARHSIELRAPRAGTVTAIESQPGQIVASGQRMLTILPAGRKMDAELLAPSTSIGFIRIGQRVQLRYSAFPFQKFGQYSGTVTEVSRAALQPTELKQLVPTLSPSEEAKTFYRVVVMPDRQDVTAYDKPEPLRASMQVDAQVILDKRKLYQWILEPLYSVHGLSLPGFHLPGLGLDGLRQLWPWRNR